MKAFNNDPKIKEFFVNRMNAHAEADEIIQGTGWEDGEGCFIGCTFNDYDHSKFESKGIGPEWLAHLADKIFEGLPNDKAKDFAKNFYPSMKVGIDLEQVKKDFLIFILEQNLIYLDGCEYDKKAWPKVTDSIEETKKAIELCIKYQNGEVDRESARSAAESAARSAWSAARSATKYDAESSARSAAESAWSAESAAESSTMSAAESAWYATESARYAARSAESAVSSTAESAARSAESAARSAESAARYTVWYAARPAAESAAFEKYADKLLELLKGDDQVVEAGL